jgi:hypothetical protein|tara:strand:+ start:2216 stop:2590 length:375 start_codon:yes stop_codon:yes gene_type:complete
MANYDYPESESDLNEGLIGGFRMSGDTMRFHAAIVKTEVEYEDEDGTGFSHRVDLYCGSSGYREDWELGSRIPDFAEMANEVEKYYGQMNLQVSLVQQINSSGYDEDAIAGMLIEFFQESSYPK